MKIVNVVESLNISRARLMNGSDKIEHFVKKPIPVLSRDAMLEVSSDFSTEVHSVIEIHKAGQEPVYLAYTQEVQDFLERPFDIMNNDIKELQVLYRVARTAHHDLKKIVEEASFWQRLRYLFTGILE